MISKCEALTVGLTGTNSRLQLDKDSLNLERLNVRRAAHLAMEPGRSIERDLPFVLH